MGERLIFDSSCLCVIARRGTDGRDAEPRGLVIIAKHEALLLCGGGFGMPDASCVHADGSDEATVLRAKRGTSYHGSSYGSRTLRRLHLPATADRVTASLAAVLRAGDVVAVASHYHDHDALAASQCATRMSSLLRLTATAGAYLLMLGDVPKLPSGVRGVVCAAPWSQAVWRLCGCACAVPRDVSRAQVVPVHEALQQLVRSEAGAPASFLDLHDLLCDGLGEGATCGLDIPGTASLGYRDIKHLTELGSFYLWPFLREFFEEHILPRMAAERALAESG